MDYTISVMDINSRKMQIDNEINTTTYKERFHYRGEMVALPIIRVHIGLPIYRLKNGRTSVEQQVYIQENNCRTNLFDGEEDKTAQSAQHKILLKMSKNPTRSIYDELARITKQTQPLLITASGVVVNGNRRLAAMRDLFINDPQHFSNFEFVDVMVLPVSAKLIDIETIESELQMVPETKLEYGWVERLLKLRYHKDDLKIPVQKIKEMYGFRNEAEINRELQKLSLADEYLEKFLNMPKAYQRLDQSDQAYKDLSRSVETRVGEASELRRSLGFVLITETSELNRRLYDYNFAFDKDAELVAEQLADELGINLDIVEEDQDMDDMDSDDPLSGFDATKSSRYDPIIKILQDSSKSQENITKIVPILESMIQDKKEEKEKTDAMKFIDEANRQLNKVDLSKTEQGLLGVIEKGLDKLIKKAENLKANILNITNI